MLKTDARHTATKFGKTRGCGQALPSPWALHANSTRKQHSSDLACSWSISLYTAARMQIRAKPWHQCSGLTPQFHVTFQFAFLSIINSKAVKAGRNAPKKMDMLHLSYNFGFTIFIKSSSAAYLTWWLCTICWFTTFSFSKNRNWPIDENPKQAKSHLREPWPVKTKHFFPHKATHCNSSAEPWPTWAGLRGDTQGRHHTLRHFEQYNTFRETWSATGEIHAGCFTIDRWPGGGSAPWTRYRLANKKSLVRFLHCSMVS